MVDSDDEAPGPTYPPCDLCGEACEGNQELCVPWLPGAGSRRRGLDKNPVVD
jgi:hypothetical protein